MNLDELVRLARARLAGREPDPDERESIRREEATQKLKSKIRSKLNFDTGSVLYLKNGPWMDGPSVIIDTDVCAVEPWEFVVRPVDGGYERSLPTCTPHICRTTANSTIGCSQPSGMRWT